MKTNEENLQKWRERINEQVEKNMTVRQWCEKNGFSKQQFHYWKRRVQENNKGVTVMEFVEITPIGEKRKSEGKKKEPTSAFQILINEIQVTVHEDFNSEAFA